MNPESSLPIALMWSGGKDSMLAYHVLQQNRVEVAALVTTLNLGFGGIERVSAHGVRRELLELQARALSVPLEVVLVPPASSNAEYEASFSAPMQRLRARGIATVAAGDLFLEDVRAYREALLARCGMAALFPLWNRDTTRVAHEFIALGFEAVLSCVDAFALDAAFAGRPYDASLLRDLPATVDPCGENGEFHTFVCNGPGFERPIPFGRSEIVMGDKRFCFCDLLSA